MISWCLNFRKSVAWLCEDFEKNVLAEIYDEFVDFCGISISVLQIYNDVGIFYHLC